jgi:hypothetical protein
MLPGRLQIACAAPNINAELCTCVRRRTRLERLVWPYKHSQLT